MEYLINSFIKPNKTHEDQGKTFKFSLGHPNNKSKWRGIGILLNSIYSLNTLAKLCCSNPCFLLFSFFLLHFHFPHTQLSFCVSASLNLYSSWASWGMQQLRINDGILLKKEGRHTVNDDTLLKVSSSSQDDRKLEIHIRTSLLWKGQVQSCTGSHQKLHLAPLLFPYLMCVITFLILQFSF